jgi:hypothetical protein
MHTERERETGRQAELETTRKSDKEKKCFISIEQLPHNGKGCVFEIDLLRYILITEDLRVISIQYLIIQK